MRLSLLGGSLGAGLLVMTAMWPAMASPPATGVGSPPVEEITVEAGDVNIAAQIVGGVAGGRTMIVVSGGPGLTHHEVEPVQELLARTELRVVTYDQRGLGESTAPTDEDFSLDANVADLEALRAELGSEEIDVFGFSFGGLVAQAYAAAHPDRVASLALVGSVPADAVEFESGLARSNATTVELQEAGIVPDPLPAAEGDDCGPGFLANLPISFADPGLAVPDELLETACSSAVNAATFEDLLDSSIEDVAGRLDGYSGPALVLFGDQDQFGAQEWSTTLTDLLTAAEVESVILDDTGHFVWLESDEFVPTLEDFLALD